MKLRTPSQTRVAKKASSPKFGRHSTPTMEEKVALAQIVRVLLCIAVKITLVIALGICRLFPKIAIPVVVVALIGQFQIKVVQKMHRLSLSIINNICQKN